MASKETNCGRVQWIQEISTDENSVAGAATLLDGTVFVSRRNDIVAIEATTGHQKWTVSIPHRIWTAPVVTPNRAFVGTRNGLIAVDINSRSVDWTASLDESAFSEIEDRGWITSPPAVSSDRVFIGTKAGQFAALDVASGNIDWSFTATRLPDPNSPPLDANIPSFQGPPAVADGVVAVGNWNRRLYFFNARTGELMWERVGAADYEPAPTIAGETVLATTEVDLTAFRLSDGSQLWTHSGDPGSAKLSATVVEDTVHVASGDSYSSLAIISLDKTDLSIDWRVPGRPQTSASADRGTLYLGMYGNLVAIDRSTGRIAWEMKMESVASGPPIVTNDAVIALDKEGFLYGIDTSGKK